jgi:hypothetical protein
MCGMTMKLLYQWSAIGLSSFMVILATASDVGQFIWRLSSCFVATTEQGIIYTDPKVCDTKHIRWTIMGMWVSNNNGPSVAITHVTWCLLAYICILLTTVWMLSSITNKTWLYSQNKTKLATPQMLVLFYLPSYQKYLGRLSQPDQWSIVRF